MDDHPRCRHSLDNPAKQGKAPSMREEGQGTHAVDNRQLLVETGPVRGLLAERRSRQKSFDQSKIASGNAESAADRRAGSAGADEGKIDPVLDKTVEEIGKRAIGGRESTVRYVDQVLAELYSSYADLHFSGL